MRTARRFVVALFLVALETATGAELTGSQGAAGAQRDRDRFVGAWRLAWLEEVAADGTVHRADCTGLFVFTQDGYASVQVMYRHPGSGDANLDVPRRRRAGAPSGGHGSDASVRVLRESIDRPAVRFRRALASGLETRLTARSRARHEP